MKLTKVGTRKTVKRFAFFPTRLSNEDRILFETFYVDMILTYHWDGLYWSWEKVYQKDK